MNATVKTQDIQAVATRIVEAKDFSELLSTDLLSAASRSLSADYDSEYHVISVVVEYTRKIEVGSMTEEISGEEPTQPGSEDLELAWRQETATEEDCPGYDLALAGDIEYETFLALGDDAPFMLFTFVDVTDYNTALEREVEFTEEG